MLDNSCGLFLLRKYEAIRVTKNWDILGILEHKRPAAERHIVTLGLAPAFNGNGYRRVK